MSIKRRITRAIPVAAAGFAALLATAVPAHAENTPWVYASNHGAKGKFTDDGNRITVCDIKSDGYKAILWIKSESGNAEWYRDDGFNDGHCTTSGSPIIMNPGYYYQIQVCIAHGTYSVDCGNWYRFYNYN